MDLEELKILVLKQAEEKGFGIRPEDVIVSEKIALIHTEISESYQAYLKKQMTGPDGFYEELGDVLQRVLHLGGIFGIDFSIKEKIVYDKKSIESHLLDLHNLTSQVYEDYRRKNDNKFKKGLIKLAYSLEVLSENFDFSLKQIVLSKIERNKKRLWDKKKYNEKLV